MPDGKTAADSSNLRFQQDFPSDYDSLPTVSFVIPNMVNDMHNGVVPTSVTAGDTWLRQHLDGYYNWAKDHNSLLIVTFDESSESPLRGGDVQIE
jgi:acid phosphatase